jgi:hypothetical protein
MLIVIVMFDMFCHCFLFVLVSLFRVVHSRRVVLSTQSRSRFLRFWHKMLHLIDDDEILFRMGVKEAAAAGNTERRAYEDNWDIEGTETKREEERGKHQRKRGNKTSVIRVDGV